MILAVLILLSFCQLLLAQLPLSHFAALPFVEISDEDEARISTLDNSTFSHHIPVELREKGSVRDGMTAVQDQGQRGTCNTFAAIGLIEFYEGGDFSEQCLSYFSSEEDSGSADERVDWAVEHGLYREAECHYDGRRNGRGTIPSLSGIERTFISGEFEYYPQHRYNAIDTIRDFIKLNNPVIVDIYTAGQAWEETGIIDLPNPGEIQAACVVEAKGAGKKCKKHSVIITAFDDNEEYLEFKNSWGRDWPFSGPIKGQGYGRMSYAYFKKMKVYGAQMVSKYAVKR